jgi:hypothetical protein
MDRRLMMGGLIAFGGCSVAQGVLAGTDYRALLNKVLDKSGDASAIAGGHDISNKDADAGLRQTLSLSTASAVTRVSKPDGYWGDDAIRIPLPHPLASAQSLLKPLGQSGMLDDVHLHMNRAAEAAAPVAKGLFLDAIKGMTIQDAVGIIRGGPTSGTDYLQKTTTPRLTTLFTPPMESALQSTGAVHYLDEAVQRNKLQGVVKTDAKTYLGHYAVGLALGGLFHYVGTEEASIRHDPGKTGAQLLKTVFG